MVKINSFEFFEGIRPEGSKGCAEGREKNVKKRLFWLLRQPYNHPPLVIFSTFYIGSLSNYRAIFDAPFQHMCNFAGHLYQKWLYS